MLNLLYVFSKRSTFLTRLSNEKRQILYSRLEGLAESWGGKDNGFGLAECCDANFAVRQRSATTVHFEFRVGLEFPPVCNCYKSPPSSVVTSYWEQGVLLLKGFPDRT